MRMKAFVSANPSALARKVFASLRTSKPSKKKGTEGELVPVV
jgi:hypothetical protein